MEICTGDRTGFIPCPGLLGAILVKTRAVDVDDVPGSQLSDLAFLCSLVPDPRALIPEFAGRERSWLKRRKELQDREHPAWHGLGEAHIDDAYLTFKILSGI